MKNSFFDYYKTILERVSFDKNLFNKEYEKALRTIDKDEINEFHQWLKSSGLRSH